MPSIDTNLILRLLLDDVEEQRAATLKVLQKHDTVAIADLAITEAVFVLEKVKKIPRAYIETLLESLLANQHLVFNRSLIEQVIPYYLKHPAISFNDCCLAVYAKSNGQTPLLTFDKKLARQLPYVDEVK